MNSAVLASWILLLNTVGQLPPNQIGRFTFQTRSACIQAYPDIVAENQQAYPNIRYRTEPDCRPAFDDR